ncbi:MAG: glucosamine-6-phosphate deaminase [Actinomycetes bacterium]
MNSRHYDDLEVRVYSDTDLAHDAARDAAEAIAQAVAARGSANVMLATGNSQLAFLSVLTTLEVDWSRVTVFHMDEYVGVGEDHPASFARYIRQRVVDKVRPAAAYLLDGANEVSAEIKRYGDLIGTHPLDLTCLGIGENGHLAFNDPPVADFADPLDVKEVELDLACRQQQVGEGHFPDIDAVPRTAITLTIPALLRAGRVLAIVPEERKAAAVRAALTGPIETSCPASILRRTLHATLFLDSGSSSLL